MQTVQFSSKEGEAALKDFAELGITAEIIRPVSAHSVVIVACYENEREACRLRDYLETHHCSVTPDGRIKTVPADGWDTLVEAAVH